MRKIKRRMRILSAKIAELESMLAQNMVGQPAAIWLKIRDAFAVAVAELDALRNK